MHTGIAIALAWPETLCKQAGAWYDGLMNTFGFSKNNYYKVGHAAVVLIEKESGNCFYFDFGRYHAPFGHGRVRDIETDHDLEILTKAKFDENKNISNIEQILNELAQNEACHGLGTLHASFTNINFDKAYQNAKSMQEKSPWKYGPFIWSGTNCSRFVRTVILYGEPLFVEKLKLTIPYTISPLPIGNVKSLKGYNLINTPNEINSNSNYVLEKEICQQNHCIIH